MSGPTSDTKSREGKWTIIGSIAGVAGVVVALALAFLPGEESKPATNTGPGTTERTAPSVTVVPPTAAAGTPTTVIADPPRSLSNPVEKIVSFEAVPRTTDYLVGDHQFIATQTSNSIQLSFTFDVKGADGFNITECNITSSVTTLDGSNTKTPTSSQAHCPSRSSYTVTRGYMKPGKYRLDSEVFVPSTGDKANTSYEFVIVPAR